MCTHIAQQLLSSPQCLLFMLLQIICLSHVSKLTFCFLNHFLILVQAVHCLLLQNPTWRVLSFSTTFLCLLMMIKIRLKLSFSLLSKTFFRDIIYWEEAIEQQSGWIFRQNSLKFHIFLELHYRIDKLVKYLAHNTLAYLNCWEDYLQTWSR